MTREQWEYIFKTRFWDRWKADDIDNQAIANLLVDWVWASGVYGIKYPQAVLGVKTDGIVGLKTLAAINYYPNKKELFEKLWNRRKSILKTSLGIDLKARCSSKAGFEDYLISNGSNKKYAPFTFREFRIVKDCARG